MMDITDAINALHPENSYVLRDDDYSQIEWVNAPSNPATLEQVNAKVTELKADYDSKQYQRDRAEQYPKITDVVVALAEKEEGDDTMWKQITTLRQKVKSDIPKPT